MASYDVASAIRQSLPGSSLSNSSCIINFTRPMEIGTSL
jgi:hypothetical protein